MTNYSYRLHHCHVELRGTILPAGCLPVDCCEPLPSVLLYVPAQVAVKLRYVVRCVILYHCHCYSHCYHSSMLYHEFNNIYDGDCIRVLAGIA